LKDSSAFNETAKEKIQAWYNEMPSANEDGVH
jgi:ATP-dependent DNA helicase RecG